MSTNIILCCARNRCSRVRKDIEEGIYIVFIENEIDIEGIEEAKEMIDGFLIKTYLIKYDEKTDFGKDTEEV